MVLYDRCNDSDSVRIPLRYADIFRWPPSNEIVSVVPLTTAKAFAKDVFINQ
jgi:hypothetical protein